ncbi:HAD hydrolase family protein [Stenotrophomonas koreensis]|uniref:KdsC family phosphatase n=1 Tax=Stenotrophomonas koreensis TaxID=266128 RepID=UPI0033919BAE
MPFDPLYSLTPALIQRARRIRMACFDVDGTLTDGRLYYDHQGNESKAYFVQDGLGLKLLQRHGIVAVIITARHSASAAKRGADLKIETHIGVRDKLALLQQLCQREGIELDQVAFIGDDLPDITCLRAVGLSVAPADAHPWVAQTVHWQTEAGGGRGAARQLCDVLLAAGGHLEAVLAGEQP